MAPASRLAVSFSTCSAQAGSLTFIFFLYLLIDVLTLMQSNHNNHTCFYFFSEE